MTTGEPGPEGTSGPDRQAMARAIALAERGRATARPNPMVGCVLLRDGRVVGEGWHERPGGPHAEIVALDAAGDQARGATAYVTLEPCDHHGRTGPCSVALLEAGVSEVVYALDDPDPEAQGGARRLRDAGVRVRSGPFVDWVEVQNEVFLHTRRVVRPWFTLKLAQTLDGQLRSPVGERFITGEVARRAVHRLRTHVDAVLVGSRTVLDDDPALNVRHVDAPYGQPVAVVLDARGRTPLGARVVVDRGTAVHERPTIVLTTQASPSGWRDDLATAGVDVEVLPAAEGGGVDLDAVADALLRRALHHVLVEGGGTVAGAFVERGLIDRLVLHVALPIVGPVGLPGVTPAATPPDGWTWRTEKVGRLGRDLEVVAVPSVDAVRRAGR